MSDMDFAGFNCSDEEGVSPIVVRAQKNVRVGSQKRQRRIIESDDESEASPMNKNAPPVSEASPSYSSGASQPSVTVEVMNLDEGWIEKRDRPVPVNKGLIRKKQAVSRSSSMDSLLMLPPGEQTPSRSMSSPDLVEIVDTPPIPRKAPNVALIKSSTAAADRSARHDNRGRKPVEKRVRNRDDSSSVMSDASDSSDNSEDLDANEWDDEVDDIAQVKEKVKYILDHCDKLSTKLRTTMTKWNSADGKSAADCVNLTAISSPSGGDTDAGGSALLQQEDFKTCCPGLSLKGYQTVGVNWMRLLHENKVNGVLADDMGLGKTIQTIAFLSWLKARNEAQGKHQAHLIVVPASTLDNWLNEFDKFGPLMAVEPYRGSQTERFHLQRPFLRAIEDGEIDVILCTYTTFERDSGKPDRKFLSRIPFSYLVLDEAHCIKNANSTRFETLGQLQSRHRLLLSGTPVQNDVKELLNLLSFLTPKVFRRKDVRTLFLGLAIDEKNGYRGTAKELIPIRHIRTMMSPFVMRRMKVDVLGQLPQKNTTEKLLAMCPVQQKVYENIIKSQLRKKGIVEIKSGPKTGVVDLADDGTPLSAEEKAKQEAKAKKKLKAEKELLDLMSCTGPQSGRGGKGKEAVKAVVGGAIVANTFEVVNLVEAEADKTLPSFDVENDIDSVLKKMKTSDINNLFTALRKAANHPLMLRVHYSDDAVIDLLARVSLASGHFGEQADYAKVRAEIETFSDFDINRLCLDYPSSLGHLQLPSSVLYDSAKMIFLRDTLPVLVAEDHRILIFSQWTRILDLLEVLLQDISFRYLRLDGSTPVSTRQDLINTFNEDRTIPVFLLSTKAGGLGINLTAADTVILHDLDMNPENDRQAEDRSHRIGQTKPVSVYKLVVENTVDEGILDMGKRKTELIKSVLVSDSTSKKATAAEDKAIIATLLQKAMSGGTTLR